MERRFTTHLRCNEVRCYRKKPKGEMLVFSVYNLIILLLLCSWIAAVDAQDETVTVEITNLPEGVQNGAFEVTIAFSEAVVNFETGDIDFSDDSVDASVTELTTPDEGETDHKKVYTATITPTDDVSGNLTFGVPENVVKSANADAGAEDNNAASDSHTVKVDLVSPTVSITDAPTTVKLGAFEVIITFTEPVLGFEADDIQLTGDVEASVTNLTTPDEGADNHRIVWTAEITPAADTATDGDIILVVPEDVAKDVVEHANAASESRTIWVDVTPPTVSITDVPNVEKNVAFDLTITFSEAVEGLDPSSLAVTGPATASLKEGTDGDITYKVTITPDTLSEGDVTIQVEANAAQDPAQNYSTASAVTNTIHIDTIPPTVEISNVPDIEKNEAFDITITFSEPINGFQVGDISLTGPTTISLEKESETDSVYRGTITPNQVSEGDVTFHIPAAIAQDFALNDNIASDSHTVHIDTIPPTVTITGVPTTEQNQDFTLTITFSEAVTGFDKDDLAVTGEATATATSGSGTAYTATITPNANAESDVTLQVKTGATQDPAQNNSTASDSHTVHIDTIPPTVAITSIPTIEKNVPFDITIAFSEPVNGFAVGDITLTGPATVTLESERDGDSEYIASIAPNRDAEGDVTLQVVEGAIEDFAFNVNTASNTAEVHVDTILPTVEIIDVPHDVQLEMFSVTIAFSEDVLEFEIADITLTGDAVVDTSELIGTGDTYTLTIRPHEDTDGDVTIQVLASVAEDNATNPNTAATPQTVSVAPKWIPDPNIRIVVREELGLDEGEDFARKQLTDLTIFNGFYREITDLTGLEYAIDLIEIDLEGNAISDLIALSGLTRLTTLNLNDNHISDIDSVANLTELIVLFLNGNRIDDLTPLTDLTKLKTLNLRENLISDLQPLAALTALNELDLTANQIQDAAPLGGLRNLVTLRISDNLIEDADLLIGLAEVVEADIIVPSLIADTALKNAIREALDIPVSTRLTVFNLLNLTTLRTELSGISDLTGLERATSLTTLDLSGNNITDITPLEDLTSLRMLNLSDNSIIDVIPLEGLMSLTTLDLSGNSITDITPLEGLMSLATLDLSGNSITDITPLEDLEEISTLNLSRNPIGNLDPLLGLIGLTVLEIRGNDITNLNVISGLTGLRRLNLSDNAITDITFLGNLEHLTTLNLSGNAIGNLNVISQLMMLTVLKLNACSITDLTPLADLTNLVILEIGGNTIRLLDAITTLTALEILDVHNNDISEVGPLAALTRLAILDLRANSISNVKPLPRLVNLETLHLAGNPILDTTPLYPLTRRVPPVDIDIAISQHPPWDVNEDGHVNATDSAIVKAALGQSGDGIVNPRTDINGDGTVDNSDLRLVTNNFEEEERRAAPAIVGEDLNMATLGTLDRASLQAYLELLRAESDGSLKYQRLIALIASFLASQRPEETRLLANYPNPFNPETWIPYQLADSSDVQIFIYDVRGAVIRHLKLGHQPAGYYIEKKQAAYWDGKNDMGESVASGIYFCQLQTDNISLLREMVILK